MRQLYLSTNHFQRLNARHYLEEMHRHGVSHMVAYPSAAALVADAATELQFALPQLRLVIGNAEGFYPWQRVTVETGLKCVARETYGMAELAAAASECDGGRLHIWPEVGLIEIIDDADRPTPVGVSGRLVGTSLLNADMPLIRYDTGDRASLSGVDSCSCGRMMPILSAVEGRANDVLVGPTGRAVHWVNPVFYGLPLREAQVIQLDWDRVLVRVVRAPEFDSAAAKAIADGLRTRLGEVTVELEELEAIPRASNGKFRAVVSAIPLAERERALRG